MSLERRRLAAEKYRPERVRVLLVAEGPPAAEDRYFYFENVRSADWLFRYTVKAALRLSRRPERSEKQARLREFQERGFFLIDLSETPVRNRSKLRAEIPGLIDRCRALAPDCIILIKANVFDLCYEPLRAAQLPVVNVRIPFPAAGRQREFEVSFPLALEACA